MADEAEPPGVRPPERTYIRPATTAAPKPWRADGILAWALQLRFFGS